MSKKVAGRFYFKKTINGNLIGEWSNNNSSCVVFSESCDVIEQPGEKNSFEGKYSSTWQENGQPVCVELEITPSQNTKLYTLKWRGSGQFSGSNFDGDGMLCDDILIGDYRSHP